jgi:histidinol-phosphatase (PHP family)
MIYRTDYHTHTTYSDGKATPEELIVQAKSIGIKELGFSEHINLINKMQTGCMDPARAPEYVSHIKKLRKRSRGVKIRTGLEVDYFPGMEKVIYDFIGKLEIDYVIGSVHYLTEKSVDSNPEYYRDQNFDDVFKKYFDFVNEAVASGLFDIIGHCDLVRIFNLKPSFDPEYLYRNLAENMKIHDVAFEINTNGRNKKVGDFYPDRRFLKIFADEKIPVCVNSDAHFPERIGQFFDEAYSLLKDAGYKEMAVFNQRERFMVPAKF